MKMEPPFYNRPTYDPFLMTATVSERPITGVDTATPSIPDWRTTFGLNSCSRDT